MIIVAHTTSSITAVFQPLISTILQTLQKGINSTDHLFISLIIVLYYSDLIANILPSDEEPLLAGKRNFPGSTNDVYTSDVEPMERARYPSDLSQYTNDQTPRTPASILDSISPDEIRRLLRPIDRRAVEPIRVQPEIFATKSPTEDIRLLMEFSSTDDTGLSSGESDMEKFARLRSMVEQGEKKKPWRQETLKSPPSTVVNIDKRPAQVHQNESSPEISEESQTEVPKSQKPLLTNDPKISKPFITDKDSTPSHTQTNAPEKPIASKPTEESAKKPEIPKSLPLISSIESLKPADTSSYKVPKAWDISPDLQSSTKEEENASDESCSSEETTMSTSVVKAKPSGLDSSKPLATTFVAWPAPDEVKLKPVRVLEPISTEIISTPSETEIEEESQVEETPMRRPRLKIKMSPSSSCASSPSPDRKPLIIKQTMVKSSSPMRKPTEGPTDSPKASKPPIPHVKPESPANVAKRPTLPGSLSGSDSESSSSLGPRSSRASLTKAAGHRTRPESPAKVRSRPPIPTGSQQGKFSKSFKEAKSDSTEQSSKESNV